MASKMAATSSASEQSAIDVRVGVRVKRAKSSDEAATAIIILHALPLSLSLWGRERAFGRRLPWMDTWPEKRGVRVGPVHCSRTIWAAAL